jgi:cytochrome P450
MLDFQVKLRLCNPAKTVTSILAYIFYHLFLDPSQIDKIHAELNILDSILDTTALRLLPHLNATINRNLRLHPALPTGGLRNNPPEVITIAGTYIPGSVTFSAPQYILGRCELLQTIICRH